MVRGFTSWVGEWAAGVGEDIAQQEHRLETGGQKCLEFRTGGNISSQTELTVDAVRAVGRETDAGAQAEAAALVVDTSLLAASKDFGSPDQGQVAAHAMDQFVILGDVAAPEVTVEPLLGEGAAYPRAAERRFDVENGAEQAEIETETLAVSKEGIRPGDVVVCIEQITEFFEKLQFEWPGRSRRNVRGALILRIRHAK